MVSFWHGCLGNECNEITIPAKFISKNVYTLQSCAQQNYRLHNIYDNYTIIQQSVNRKQK